MYVNWLTTRSPRDHFVVAGVYEANLDSAGSSKLFVRDGDRMTKAYCNALEPYYAVASQNEVSISRWLGRDALS
jgi:hypothetical protein